MKQVREQLAVRRAEARVANPPFGLDTGATPYPTGGNVKVGRAKRICLQLCLSSRRAVQELWRARHKANGRVLPYQLSPAVRDGIKKQKWYKGPPRTAKRGLEAEQITFQADTETLQVIQRYMVRCGCTQSQAVRTLLIAAARPRREWVLVTPNDVWD